MYGTRRVFKTYIQAKYYHSLTIMKILTYSGGILREKDRLAEAAESD